MEIKSVKKCTKCEVEKELGEFVKNKSKKDGISNTCKECKNKRNSDKYLKNPEYREKRSQEAKERYKEKLSSEKISIDFSASKPCIKCSIEKTLDNFTKSKIHKDGVENICKDCKNAHKRNKVKNYSEYREKLNKQGRDWYLQKANQNKQQDLNLISKVCSKCGIEKDGTCFNKHKSREHGLTDICKECRNTYLSDKGKENPEYRNMINQKRKTTYKLKKDDNNIIQNITKICKYCNIEKNLSKFVKDVLCNDGTKNICYTCLHKRNKKRPEYKMNKTIRGSIKRILKNRDNECENKYLGYTRTELVEHLEKQFDENMSWDNYGTWHVDHIIPISKFEKTTPIYIINHLENLQPLNGTENMSKNNRIELLPERTIGEHVLILNQSGKYQLKNLS